jgi:membrane protein implicated in regulation of membrane protease activity
MAFNLIEFFAGKKPSSRFQDCNFRNLRGAATVDELIQPGNPGRVKFQGTWWSAQCDLGFVLLPGQLVQVVGVDNITLIVEPVAAEALCQFA